MSTDAIILTDAQDRVMRHALGLVRSKLPYRNGFMAPVGHAERGVCEVLVGLGLMSCSEPYFFVTSRGFQLMFGRNWEKMKARAEE